MFIELKQMDVYYFLWKALKSRINGKKDGHKANKANILSIESYEHIWMFTEQFFQLFYTSEIFRNKMLVEKSTSGIIKAISH
jgi:hypothetical protein